MSTISRKQVIALVLALILLGAGIFVFTLLNVQNAEMPVVVEQEPEVVIDTSPVPVRTRIGTSVEGRVIEAVTFGSGPTKLLFVGGVHGGYEWNSVLLAYGFIDYFTANIEAVPSDLTVSIIPSLNPDGLFDVTGTEGRFYASDVLTDPASLAAARFNANEVDLNRNFDCKWQSESSWRGNVVSAGDAAFSEPEAVALRDFVAVYAPDAVVFWHSQANTVYASECEEGVLPETVTVMNAYAVAANYNSVESFDAYPVTGDAEGWLASLGIPAITVELETHETVEWDRNLQGVTALLNYYSEELAR